MRLPHRIVVWRIRVGRELSFSTLGQIHRLRYFTLEGRRYPYHAHRYNTTWANERTVEVPIALAALRDHLGQRVLEVGNVMGHYGRFEHEVVDKYEPAKGVRNWDILEFAPSTRYDLIISISTLEHIGFEEEVSDPGKPARAVEHLLRLLAPGGRLLITFALGYNAALDEAVRAGSLPFDEMSFLRRVSRDNRWGEVSLPELSATRYGGPYPRGNAIVVATAGHRDRDIKA